MKLKFKNQQFQTDAVDAVADLFKGREKMQSTFEITQGPQLSLTGNEFGIGNGMLIIADGIRFYVIDDIRCNNLI